MAASATSPSYLMPYTIPNVIQDLINGVSSISLKHKQSPLLCVRSPSTPNLGHRRTEWSSGKWVDDPFREVCFSAPILAAFAAGAGLLKEDATDALSPDPLSPPPPPPPLKASLSLRDKRRSKRFLEIKTLVEPKKEYDLTSAISLLKKMANTKFSETVEAHFRLNIDPKYNDQQLRATVNLPKGTGRNVRVVVIAHDEKLDEARSAGADLVGGHELIARINEGFLDFDMLISTPEIMPKVAILGKLLGPRGLMPNPKSGTVTSNIRLAIDEFKKGKVEYRADKTGIVHLPFGKANFSEEDLIINLLTVIRSIEKNKPSGAKLKYWRSVHLCSTMGPSIRISIKEMLDYKIMSLQ